MRFFKPTGWVVAALLASSAPSRAQYGAPFAGPGMLTTPEMANGVIGAGAAGATNPTCGSTAIGRDGPRYQCPQDSPSPTPRPHR